MRKWRIEDSEELYNITGWGTSYFGINDKGHVVVTPRRDGVAVDLKELVDELQLRDVAAPTLVRFPDILDNRIEKMSSCFKQAAEEYGYKAENFIIYPIKVNQMRPVVEEIISHGKKFNLGLEAGSKPELHAVIAVNTDSDSLIVCNGYKDESYIELALLAQKMGKRIFLVVEKMNELKLIAKMAKQLNVQPNIGIRIKLASSGSGKWEESGGDASKFGLTSSELLEALDFLDSKGLKDCLKLIHFHIGSQVTKIRRIKTALHDALDSDMPGLPQSEPSFRIMYTSPKDYDSTLKLIRNIVIVDIKDIYTKGTFKYAKDVYASPQMILTIQAPNEEVFEKFVEENKQTIIDFFTRAEMNRQITLLEEKHNNFISNKVDSLFGCDIWIPSELNNSKTGEDFFWASTNTGSADRNFVMYSYPYTDKDTFTKEYFVHKRDSVMKANIPGYKEGVYMSTDSLLTDVRPINVHNDYTMEARGLWRMKGDFMGGPFVSHTRLDQKNQRIITAEIFVYSPDKMKRNLVRQMEASLYTLKLPQEGQQSQIPLGVTREAEPTNK